MGGKVAIGGSLTASDHADARRQVTEILTKWEPEIGPRLAEDAEFSVGLDNEVKTNGGVLCAADFRVDWMAWYYPDDGSGPA